MITQRIRLICSKRFLPLHLAALLLVLTVAISRLSPAILADPNFPVAQRAKDQSNRFSARFSIILEDQASKFFNVSSSGCLTAININAKSVVGPPVPFCDSTNGRVLDLSGYLVTGMNSVEIFGVDSGDSPRVMMKMVSAPYVDVTKKVLPILAIGLFLIWLVQELSSKFASDKAHSILARSAFFILWIVCVILAIELTSQAVLLSRWGMLLAYSATVIPLIWLFFPIRLNIAATRTVPSDHYYLCLTLVLALAWAVYVSYGTIARHHRFFTHAFDMGIQENLIWNLSHGYGWYSSVMGNIHYLGNHTSFIYLLLVPFYRLFSASETLLIAQAVVLAAASVPLFLFARRVLESDLIAFLIAACYLMSPAIQGGAFYDFHELCFSPLLFFSVLYFCSTNKRIGLWTSALLFLLVKEDTSVVLACLGVSLLLLGNIRLGLQLSIAGVVGYFIFQHTIIPTYAGYESSYVHYFDKTISGITSPGQLLYSILSDPFTISTSAMNPERAKYLMQTLGSNGFIAIFSPASFLVQSYGMFLAIFGGSKALYELGFQYAFNWIPQIFAGSIFVLAWSRRGGWVVISLMLIPSIAIFSMYGMVYPLVSFKGGFYQIGSFAEERDGNNERRLEVSRLISTPLDQLVVGDELTVPHLAGRPLVIPGNRFEMFKEIASEKSPN